MNNPPVPDRDRIAAAIRAAACPGNCGKTEEECAKERIQPFAWHHGRLAVVEGTPEQFADAVLGVWPAGSEDTTTTQAAVALRDAADFYDQLLTDMGTDVSCDPRYWTAVRDIVRGLRCRADEAQQQPEASAAHSCGNCEGEDPDTCWTNPNRPPEPCPAAEFGDYGQQCGKPVGHELHTFEEQQAAAVQTDEEATP